MKKKPKIMWILNITPDSFYDWWDYYDLEKAKAQINKMIEEWADIIDVWGFSSRPWSIMPTVEEELKRIKPILDYLDDLNISFSVDTCRNEIVKEIVKYKNLKYINDISWLSDEKILDYISWTDIWYILMHIKWNPENMQNNPEYNDIIWEINDFFEKKLKLLREKNIKNIILDPWFWFWKTTKHNYIILKNLEKFNKFWLPILVWISRKSMIYKLLETTPENVLWETQSLNLYALQKWADILRVHDVLENKNIVKIFELIDNL